jgi:ABC-2 type transport system permease protein
MTMTAAPSPTRPGASPARSIRSPHPTRTTRSDVEALPNLLRSEWIKVSSLRSNRVILGLAVAIAAVSSWAAAVFVTDEVLTVADAFVFPSVLVAVLATVAGILLFTSEAQHGTLATTMSAQPARWVVAAAMATAATAMGLVLGTVGMITGAAGAAVGGLEWGSTSAMASTALWTLLFTALSAVIGLAIGMVVRHSAGAVSGLLVWWFVAENLLHALLPPNVGRFLPFDAGYHLLSVGSDFDTPEQIAAELTRPQYALVFTAYALAAAAIGTYLFHRRDPN